MESNETRWWWIRHAPVVGPNDHIYGQRDLEANCSDDALFKGIANMLPDEAVLITSDLRRTIQTADAIGAAGLPLSEATRDPAMREQHLGTWQGKRRDEFARERPRRPGQSWLAPAFERAPEGESFVDLIARVGPAVNLHTETHRGRDIICVAHGGTIRAALAVALGLDPERVLNFSIANCSVTRLDHIHDENGGGDWHVAMVNWLPG
jgi:broad specificity phosphatase PhoE